MAGETNDTEMRRVWDLPTRFFHWALVGCVIVGWYLGKFGPIGKTWHFYLGYVTGGLLLFRLIWGFVGPAPAHFSSLFFRPATLIAYMRHAFSREPSHWHGHNPLGALSVLAMLGLLMAQFASGLFADDEIFAAGPLAEHVSISSRGFASMVHAISSKLLLLFILIHISAILFYLIRKRENLIRPMITGWKKVKLDKQGKD